MKNVCVIIAGGNCGNELAVSSGDFIIAADSGLAHCLSAGITPDLIVGDFDSFAGAFPAGVEVIKLPIHKDDTDLMFAARCAVELGVREIRIFGGYGSRPDQNLAMYQTLLWIKNHGVEPVAICTGFEVSVLKNESRTFCVGKERYLSVFAADGTAEGVYISGAEYPLREATVTSDFPIGVSNVSKTDATVSVKNGILFVMTVDKAI